MITYFIVVSNDNDYKSHQCITGRGNDINCLYQKIANVINSREYESGISTIEKLNTFNLSNTFNYIGYYPDENSLEIIKLDNFDSSILFRYL